MWAGSPFFTEKELACKCGCGMLPEVSFIEKLVELRRLVNFPFIVSSGARCPAHNLKESNTGEDGPHTTGRAVDIKVHGENAYRLVEVALERGFTGVGVRQKGDFGTRFIHLDDLPKAKNRPRPTIWSY